MADAAEIASWMLEIIRRTHFENRDVTYQNYLVYDIAKEFGDEWTYENDNGNLAISKEVLKAFGKVKAGNVRWDRGSRYWEWTGPR